MVFLRLSKENSQVPLTTDSSASCLPMHVPDSAPIPEVAPLHLLPPPYLQTEIYSKWIKGLKRETIKILEEITGRQQNLRHLS